jgi:enoyl-[acyl-carrier protein] reductase II
MASRPFWGTIAYRAFSAAQKLGIPLWKVLPGLVTQFEKMFIIAQFGAATEQIMNATVDGKLEKGVQFIGQSQGMIHDITTVDEILQRMMKEAQQTSIRNAQLFANSKS